MTTEPQETELSFLLDLVLDEKTPAALKKRIKDRIKLVEGQYQQNQGRSNTGQGQIAQQYQRPFPAPPSVADQPESTRRLMAKHGMIPEMQGEPEPAQEIEIPAQAQVAPQVPVMPAMPMGPQTPAAARALQQRAALINKSIKEPPLKR